jgi:hypothetical protein
MSDVNVVELEDVIPKLYQNQIEAETTSERMAWFFSVETGRAAQYQVDASYSGFSHTVFHADEGASPSPMTALLLPLLFAFCDKAQRPFNRLLRIRLGLFPRTNVDALHHNPHVDFYQPHYNALYYVNDSDGDTFVFNETFDDVSQAQSLELARAQKFTIAKRITPKKGKMVGFDGKHYHASMHPTASSHRIAIAFSFR